jgi:hypothetical protein
VLNLLQSVTGKLQLVTSAAGDIDVVVSGADTEATGATAFDSTTTPTIITTAATTDIFATPGASDSRNAKFINVRNVHASTSNVVTVQLNSSATIFELFKCTLLPGEWCTFSDGVFFHYTANGAVYSAGGSVVDPSRNDFRLSGVTATPVMTADSTTLGTIFLCQYKGNHLSLFDGTNWQDCAPATEISLAVTGRTTDLPFDIFAFLSSGIVTLEFLNWTNATTRATTLVRLDGVLVKSGDSTRRYVGSCRPRSATTYHWVRNGDDLPVKFDLYNSDNLVEFGFMLRALTNTWAYTIATWRQAQASANYQIDVMVGIQEGWFNADLIVSSRNATISIPRHVGIGFDSTTAISGFSASTANTVASIESDQNARIAHMPTVGRHFYAWLEISTATGTCTWIGDDGALRLQSGMAGSWKC